jgi:formate dehydrogenase subunit beta
MKEKIINHVKELLASGRIKGFLALRQDGEEIGPFLFTDPDELDKLSLGDKERPGDARYPLPKVLSRLVAKYPTETFGILVRGCDERALERLIGDSVFHRERVVPIGFSCPPELAQACQCHKPWPDNLVAGEETPGVDPEPADQSSADLLGQLRDWFNTFDRCVKCFGCRDICPVCSCKECTLEEDDFIPQRDLPASRNFLMTRAMHMVDRCVYCGLCEQACPADIPLKSLYKLVARIAGREAVPTEAPAGLKAGRAAQQA